MSGGSDLQPTRLAFLPTPVRGRGRGRPGTRTRGTGRGQGGGERQEIAESPAAALSGLGEGQQTTGSTTTGVTLQERKYAKEREIGALVARRMKLERQLQFSAFSSDEQLDALETEQTLLTPETGDAKMIAWKKALRDLLRICCNDSTVRHF